MFRLRYLTQYRLLNVEENASTLQIRVAYHQGLEQAASGTWKERLIGEVNGRTPANLRQAFKELSDPSCRTKYDEYLERVRNMQLCLLN
jgi:DnaJ-class molecular chaperone